MKLSDLQNNTSPKKLRLSDLQLPESNKSNSQSNSPIPTAPQPTDNPIARTFNWLSKDLGDSLSGALGSNASSMELVNGTPVDQATGDLERKQVVDESLASGLFGVTPQHPELQAKYPGRAFGANLMGGTLPYMAPGGALLKFTAIPAAHEIIRQSTSSEELSPAQRTFKVGTSAGAGYLTGRIFQGSDILKTIAQRVAAKSIGGGTVAAIDSVAQDVESGRDPELHQAMTNGMMNASLIGVLGAAVEFPALRSAVVQEGSLWAGKPVSFKEAKSILTKGDVDIEKLSPNLQAAVKETQRASLEKTLREKASAYGVSPAVMRAVMKDQGNVQRLNLIDEHIYQMIKRSTGRIPQFDWRQGLDYKMDFSTMNPATRSHIQTLLNFRKEIAAGADPVDILWRAEVAKQLKPKEYIQAALKEQTRNIKSEHQQFIKANEPLKIKPTEEPQANIESAGGESSVKPVTSMTAQESMSYMPYLNQALARLKDNPEEQRDIPEATAMNYLQRDSLLEDIKHKVASNAAEPDIMNFIAGKLSPDDNNPTHEISVMSSHQGKEDSADAVIYDWRNMKAVSISDYARDLKQLNDKRKASGFPTVKPAEVVVRRTAYKGQKTGVAKQVSDAIVREYNRAKLTNPTVPPSSALRLSDITPEPVSPTDEATSLPENNQENATPFFPTAETFDESQVPPIIAQQPSATPLRYSDILKKTMEINRPSILSNAMRVVAEAGGVLKSLTGMEDSLYEDEPTIYFDVVIDNPELPATFSIRPSQLSVENVLKKIGQNSKALAAAKVNADKIKSEKLEKLHANPARIKGFDTAFDGEIKQYFKELEAAASDPSLIQGGVIDPETTQKIKDIVLDAEMRYHSGDISGAISASEKALMYIHERADIQHYPTRLNEILEPQNKVVRTVVEGREGIEKISQLTLKLKDELGRNPTPEEIAGAAGATVQEIRDLLNIPTLADNPEMADEFLYKDSEIPYELTQGVDILKDLYEGISAKPYEEAMEELLGEQTKKSFRKKPNGKDPFKLTKRQQENVEQAANLDKMSKELSQHKSFLLNQYLGELKTAVGDMSDESQKIIKKATEHLSEKSEAADVLFSIHDINKELDAVNAEIQPANLSPEERDGGATFVTDEPIQIDSNGQMIELPPGEYNMSKSGDIDLDGNVVNISKAEFHRLAQEGLLDVDYSRYIQPKPEPKLDEKFKFKGKWIKDESGKVLFFPTKMIFQYSEVERDAPIMVVLDQMNKVPWMSDIRKHFKTSQTIKHEDAALRAFYKVDQDIHDKLWSTKVYEAAVKDLAQVDLHPIHDDVLLNIQDFMAQQGAKDFKKKEVFQPMLDQYSELMAEAAEQIMVTSWEPSNYSFSNLGHGPHNSPEEVDAYVKSVKKWYEFFKIPQQDQIPDAQLVAARTPVFWDLLVHPNVMHNDNLQRAILFYKAQIEMPLLEQQIKWGIYSNADIWKSIKEGYHKHGWTPAGAQQGGSVGFKRGGTSSIQRPTREIRTMQLHKAQGEVEGWSPIADFFNNNYDYMVEAMKGIKQAQLHKELSTVRMANPIEYTDPEFIVANAKSPSPHEFFWVQHETDANIIDEAQRMGKLLGKKVSPMKILEQGGWMKGNADDGLNKWYRGSFQPPFIYRTLYNEIRTLWRGRQQLDKMGAIAQAAQKLKFITLSLPTDTAAQYLGNMFLDRPLWQIVPYMATLPSRTLFHAMRGLGVGMKIKSGNYTYQVGKNEHQVAWNRLFVEEGLVATAGYKAFLNNLLDKESRGIFPQRQDKIEDLNDYFMSVFGMNQAVMGEMIAQDVLNAGIVIAEREVARGRSVREAAKFTAHYLNTAVWMLHRDVWQGNLGVHLRNFTYSRNFTIIPLRVMAILSRLPLGLAIKKTGAGNFKTESGGGKEATNVVMANDIPERFMPTIAWKFLSVFTGLFFLAFLSKLMMKESFRMMSGRDELPDDARGAIPMYMQDVNGQELYMDFQFWKMGRDIVDLTSTVIDPVGQLITGNDQFDTGKGAVEWLKGKLGVIFTLQELFGLKNNDDGTPVYDRDDKEFKNAQRFARKFLELTPINPFVGQAAPKVPYSRDPLVDSTMRAVTALGISIKPTQDQETKDIKATVRSELFQQREDRANIFTREQADQAYREHKISKETLKNKIMEINSNQSGHDVQFWKKRDKSVLRDAILRNRREEP